MKTMTVWGLLAGLALSVPAAAQESARPIISQIAAYGTWRTTVVLINKQAEPSAYRLQFRDALGNPLVLLWEKLEGEAVQPPVLLSELSGTIPGLGLVMFRTARRPQDETRQGYAQLVEGEGNVAGQAIFQQTQPGGFEYAAASLLTPPVQEFLLPFDNLTPSPPDNRPAITAAAWANPRISSCTVQTLVRDAEGQIRAQPSLQFREGEHRASELAQLVGLPVRNRIGVVDGTVLCGGVGLLGLRFAGPFSSFEPTGKQPWESLQTRPPTIAQIVADGTWTTTLFLMNAQATPRRFRMELRESSGAPLDLQFTNLTASTPIEQPQAGQIAGEIPGGGVLALRTITNPSAPTKQGFAKLLEGVTVQGQAIFTQETAAGRFEAASPLRMPASRFMLPFDNVGGVVTSVALANPSDRSVTIRVQAADEFGVNLLGVGRTITLGAREHRAASVVDLLGAQLANKRGVIDFSANVAEFSALGLRFVGSTFTSFPVVDVGQ